MPVVINWFAVPVAVSQEEQSVERYTFTTEPVSEVHRILGVWFEDGDTGFEEIEVGWDGGVISIVKDGILSVFERFPAQSVINKEQFAYVPSPKALKLILLDQVMDWVVALKQDQE